MLWFMWVVLILLVQKSLAFFSPQYCADIEPQTQVNIQQLLGMWYGVEIISHIKNEKTILARKRTKTACPVIRFSEDDLPSTVSPLYQDYKYDQHYGTGYGYSGQGSRYRTSTYSPNEFDVYFRELSERVRLGTISEKERQRFLEDIKRLKILWDENGVMTEYIVRYNVSQPGVWIASGPKNGSLLETKFDNFAGTIQVFKAVGNHLVLNFCHRMPDPQLFTVLLSRSVPLNLGEISGVHNQLERKGLEMVSVTKVCHSDTNSATKLVLGSTFSFLIMLLLLLF